MLLSSQKAVIIALCCNFVVFSMKCGVWVLTSSHVMLAEAVHSLADLANQVNELPKKDCEYRIHSKNI